MPTERERDYYRMGYEDGVKSAWTGTSGRLSIDGDKPKPKRKRAPTAYQKRYGTAYKKLKRKHPRMSFGSLSKKAHKEASR